MLATLVLAVIVAMPVVATAPSLSPVPTLPSSSDVDYQLGGPSAVPEHVGTVVRDRTVDPTPPEEGRYDVCYVNGFQTQPDAKRFWRQRWSLVLRDDTGRPVVDEQWGEWLLDLRTERRRERLVRVVGRWVEGCAASGFEAVELDNLDSFTRSDGLLRPRHAAAYAEELVDVAHAAGLAVAQKNRAGWDGTSVGFDLAIAEECGRYDECESYTEVYGDQVLVVEYRRRDFEAACEAVGAQVPVVLRDRALEPDGPRAFC